MKIKIIGKRNVDSFKKCKRIRKRKIYYQLGKKS